MIKKLIACVIAIVVGMSLGFAVVFGNPECYQIERGVVTFHPTVFFGAMTFAGFLFCKFKRIRKSTGLLVALAFTSIPLGIIAPAVYYSSLPFIGMGVLMFFAAFVLSKTNADVKWSSTRIAIKATR